jgi:methylmalonyl-CoA mutase C-terminal domain/subunit
MERKIRLLVAKPAIDEQDERANIFARALSDAEIEFIYTGLDQAPKQIVETAIQADVDGIGLSILSAEHLAHIRGILRLLKKKKADQIVVFAEGIISERDVSELKKIGVFKIVSPEIKASEIVDIVKNTITKRKLLYTLPNHPLYIFFGVV